MMIAGGSEDTFNLTAIYSSIRMQAMSTKLYSQPSLASRPFDEDRSGFLLAEGSGVLILEELELRPAITRELKYLKKQTLSC